jgi:hypothetical protein
VQAYQGMMQGEETVRQGRAIVVFTIVTIVFVSHPFTSSCSQNYANLILV